MSAWADFFQDRYLARVPVVRNGKLVGILAKRDLLFGYTKASQYCLSSSRNPAAIGRPSGSVE